MIKNKPKKGDCTRKSSCNIFLPMNLNISKSTVVASGIKFGIISAANIPLMITLHPERMAAAHILPPIRSRGTDPAAEALIIGIIAGELNFEPDFNTNPFLYSATDFQKKVWREIMKIKRGETATYGDIATAMGRPGTARAVGGACNANPLALIIPCHRVVAKDGPGGFAGNIAAKKFLLEKEL